MSIYAHTHTHTHLNQSQTISPRLEVLDIQGCLEGAHVHGASFVSTFPTLESKLAHFSTACGFGIGQKLQTAHKILWKMSMQIRFCSYLCLCKLIVIALVFTRLAAVRLFEPYMHRKYHYHACSYQLFFKHLQYELTCIRLCFGLYPLIHRHFDQITGDEHYHWIGLR